MIFLFLAYALFAYRGFLRLNTICENAWMNIHVLLIRRHELITQFLDSQNSSNDAAVNKLSKIHQKAMAAEDMREQIILESELSQVMASMDANKELNGFYEECKSIEEEASQEESYFNAVAQDYSRRSTSFPSKLIAQKFGFIAPHIYKNSELFSKELSC